MARPLTALVVLAFALSFLKAPPAAAQQSWLSTFQDSLGSAPSTPPGGTDPANDDCYTAYPESLTLAPFGKLFTLWTSKSLTDGYGPTFPGWSASTFDTFMTTIVDADTSTYNDVFPIVWDYFCFKDNAPTADSINFVLGSTTYTKINVALYHDLDFIRNYPSADGCDSTDNVCDNQFRSYESIGAGTQYLNSILYSVNHRLGWQQPLCSLQLGEEGARNLGFAHELQHLCDWVNINGTFLDKLASEFLSTAGEYVSGTRWKNAQHVKEVNEGVGHLPSGDAPYNLYRLFNAYLFGHLAGSPSDLTDDYLYQVIRKDVTNSISWEDMADVLNDEFSSEVAGADGTAKLEELYQRFAIARFADDRTYGGGIYGFGDSGVSPRDFGWFEWTDTNEPRVNWMPPDLLLGEDVRFNGPYTIGTWSDPVDSVNTTTTRQLRLKRLGSEYCILRADPAYLGGGDSRTLHFEVHSSTSVPPGTAVRVSYIAYADETGDLFDQPILSVASDVPVALSDTLSVPFEVPNFGDSIEAVVVVASLVEDPPSGTTWGGHGGLNISFTYGLSSDTLTVPGQIGVIQTAIDSLASNDVVFVEGQAGGISYEETLSLKAGVRVVGVDGGHGLPTLDADGDTVAVTFPGGAPYATSLESFTVKGGTNALVNLRGSGRLVNCTLDGTTTDPPFAVNADACTNALVKDTQIILDSSCGIGSSSFGGVVFGGSIQIAGVGVGAALGGGSATLENVVIDVGTSTSSASNFGIDINGAGTFWVKACTLSASGGTAADLAAGDVTITGCRIEDSDYGVHTSGSGDYTVTGCFLKQMSEAGVDINASGTLVVECTLDSVEVGIYCGSGTVTRCIVNEYYAAGFSGGTASYCIAPGAEAYGSGQAAQGTGSLVESPLLCDGDYTLKVDSYGNPENNPSGQQIGAFPVYCMYGTLSRTSRFSGSLAVLGDATISSGDSLIVHGGGELLFEGTDNQSGGYDSSNPELIVNGVLQMDGGVDNRLGLRSGDSAPSKGDWYGVVVKSGAEAHVDSVDVAHAKYAFRFESGSSGSVAYCDFEENQVVDIMSLGMTSTNTLDISNNTFTVAGVRAIEVRYDNSNVVIENNTITNAATWTEGIWLHQGSGSTPHLVANTLSGFTLGEGVMLSTGNPTLVANEISNSKYGISILDGVAEIGDASDSDSDNFIHDNTDGIRCVGSGADPIVRNSQIYDNTNGVFGRTNAMPDLGNFTEDGLNSIYSNTYCVRNNSAGPIPAVGNWWGSCSLPTCYTGSVIVNDWKCSQPAGVADLEIVQVKPTARVTHVLGVWPNPVRSSGVIGFSNEDGYASVAVAIYDVAGRLVQQFDPAEFGPGNHHVHWDRRTRTGQTAGVGMYFARVVASGKVVGTVKILVVR